MANGKPNTARRREVRRNLPRPEGVWLPMLRRREVNWAILFCILFAAVAGFVAMTARQHPRYLAGQLVTRPIITRVAFVATDGEKTRQRKEKAQQVTPAIYRSNQTYIKALQTRFTNLIGLAQYDSLEDIPTEDSSRISLTMPALNQLKRLVNNEDKPIAQWDVDTHDFIQRLFDLAILDADQYQQHKKASDDFGSGKIVIIDPYPREGQTLEQDYYDTAIFSLADHEKLNKEVSLQVGLSFPDTLHDVVVDLVMLDPQPTYLLDETATKSRRQDAYDSEKAVTIEYEASEVLIAVGTILRSAELDLIKQEHLAFRNYQGQTHKWLARMGIFGLVLLIGAGAWGYIFAYSPKIVRNPMRGLGITALLLLCQILAVTVAQFAPNLLFAADTFPAVMAAIILAIVYDQRFALAIAAILSLLIMVSLGLPIEFGLVLLVGVATAVAQLREVRSRSKLVLVGLWTGLAMAATTLVVGVGVRPLYIDRELTRIALDAVAAAASGVLVGLFVQGVLPVIEVVFRVTTAMTLKELNDASHPLLQRLAQEAPGTYQHSLRIADMAEVAADAVGADGLLCRVGAMYHDIGKINKPAYFIENQGGGPNRHAKLSPAMSLLIIVGHVKDGVEMAREFGLPQVLRHFIESHHGTTLVEYFYHAARKQKEAEDKPGPSEFEFRYPGPKPQTREAVIMLLCDGIEAAARSLPDPTPVRLEQVVHNIANKRLMDDQFDESNLTLSDLHKIEQAITKTLCAIYHARIQYPAESEDTEQAQAS